MVWVATFYSLLKKNSKNTINVSNINSFSLQEFGILQFILVLEYIFRQLLVPTLRSLETC